MKRTIVFIHGMFLNPLSWEPWAEYFESRGYDCVTPAWPFHDGIPSVLRENPPAGLGVLSLAEVLHEMREQAARHIAPILIGHSVGGLIVQKLVSEGVGCVGIPICTVAPNRMLSLDWGFFRNSLSITNPLRGDALYPMDADAFHRNFGNTMSRADSDAAHRAYAMCESRNVLRDCMGETGEIDLERTHVPLLFIAAEQDEIIPADLCEKNARAYTERSSRVDYSVFPKTGHYICGQRGWEKVAARIHAWLDEQLEPDTSQAREIRGKLSPPLDRPRV
jgi:pimeloyl-ACP methyl ester carboxylesterase